MKSGLGLGKGLGALIPPSAQKPVDARTLPADDGSLVGITALIDISKVRPNPFQPRQDFDPQALADLANSIKEKGVIQPITVRRAENGYELIAGERRVRASIEAGMTRIPAYILDITTDADMLEIALIENVQRENLNPIEVALGYQRLIDQCNLTQEDVAEKVGKDRSTVTNFLRLLKLPHEIQESLRTKRITMGHARAMLALTESDTQTNVLKEVLEKELSVRSTEALVKNVELGRVSSVLKPGEIESQRYESKPRKFEPSETMPPELASTIGEIESRLRTVFGTQVRVRTKNSNAGSIEIDFYSIDELEGLLQKFSIIERSEM